VATGQSECDGTAKPARPRREGRRAGRRPSLAGRERLPKERLQVAGPEDGALGYTESDLEVPNENSGGQLAGASIRMRGVLRDLGENGMNEVHFRFRGWLVFRSKQRYPAVWDTDRIHESGHRHDSAQISRFPKL
jgi:hypothetical protein